MASYKITITYQAVSAPAVDAANPICRLFAPNNSASDNAAFAGTYYDTNVEGWGEGTDLDTFMKQMVAHPGLVAAVRKAIKDGSFVMTGAKTADALYAGEVAGALKEQGITITVVEETDATADGTSGA